MDSDNSDTSEIIKNKIKENKNYSEESSESEPAKTTVQHIPTAAALYVQHIQFNIPAKTTAAVLYVQHIQLNIPAKTTAAVLYVQHIQLNIPAKTATANTTTATANTTTTKIRYFYLFFFFLVFVIIFYDLIMSGGFKINKITRSMTLCILFIFFFTFVNILQH